MYLSQNIASSDLCGSIESNAPWPMDLRQLTVWPRYENKIKCLKHTGQPMQSALLNPGSGWQKSKLPRQHKSTNIIQSQYQANNILTYCTLLFLTSWQRVARNVTEAYLYRSEASYDYQVRGGQVKYSSEIGATDLIMLI